MDIRISKGTEVPVHEQVAAQLVFLIGTGALKPGASLPSARDLARRLGIHRNTINRAYGDLILNELVEKTAGDRLVVRASAPENLHGPKDLDDLVDAAVVGARQRGYSLQQLLDRLHERLVAAPPDHLLVLSDEAGMRMLLPNELGQRFRYRVEACAPEASLASPKRTIGAVVVSPKGHILRVRSVLPAGRPAVEITYSPADEYLEAVRRLQTPSLIAIVSVSHFLVMARALLAPAVGRRHSMSCYLMSGERPGSTRSGGLCPLRFHDVPGDTPPVPIGGSVCLPAHLPGLPRRNLLGHGRAPFTPTTTVSMSYPSCAPQIIYHRPRSPDGESCMNHDRVRCAPSSLIVSGVMLLLAASGASAGQDVPSFSRARRVRRPRG